MRLLKEARVGCRVTAKSSQLGCRYMKINILKAARGVMFGLYLDQSTGRLYLFMSP